MTTLARSPNHLRSGTSNGYLDALEAAAGKRVPPPTDERICPCCIRVLDAKGRCREHGLLVEDRGDWLWNRSAT